MERRRSLQTTSRSAVVAVAPDVAWGLVASGATGEQWYVDAAPFVFRGAVDRLVGGSGRAHRPPGRPRLVAGDRVGFWRVVEADHRARTLLLEAEVRAPGLVLLEVSITPSGTAEDRSRVDLTISLVPRGLLGRAYLVADLPARAAVAELTMLHLLTLLRRENPWPVDPVDPVDAADPIDPADSTTSAIPTDD